ncbi:hypothetical protein BDZ89DRAFT_1132677 [Hymenopellis radicata]|nr:hypothetical protein BDZ89DRAFT_1132677 [Hymenopellis radicata]
MNVNAATKQALDSVLTAQCSYAESLLRNQDVYVSGKICGLTAGTVKAVQQFYGTSENVSAEQAIFMLILVPSLCSLSPRLSCSRIQRSPAVLPSVNVWNLSIPPTIEKDAPVANPTPTAALAKRAPLGSIQSGTGALPASPTPFRGPSKTASSFYGRAFLDAIAIQSPRYTFGISRWQEWSSPCARPFGEPRHTPPSELQLPHQQSHVLMHRNCPHP